MPDKYLKLGILISGRGSDLQSVIDGIEKGEVAARISVVISNEPDALGLKRARRHHIPAIVVCHRDFTTRQAFEARLLEVLGEYGVGLVVLAGFMRLLTPFFLKEYPMKVINIHPALLPAFPGENVQQKAVDYGVRFAGCTVHFVDDGMDSGPIIAQAVVPVFSTDTGDVLADRILKQEHQIYPKVIHWIARGLVRVEGRRVHISGAGKDVESSLIEPVV